MKTIIGIVVVVAGIGIIYYLYKNKTLVNLLSKQTDATAKTNEKEINKEGEITYIKNTDGTITPVVTPPVVTPPVVTPPVVTPPVVIPPVVTLRYASKIGLTYNGGQAIYEKWDGVKYPTYAGTFQGIGYLANGTFLHTGNTKYSELDGEYLPIKIDVSNGVDLTSFMGTQIVNGVVESLYLTKTGVSLWDFLGAVGFLENGAMVFMEIVNAGQADEYSYYRT